MAGQRVSPQSGVGSRLPVGQIIFNVALLSCFAVSIIIASLAIDIAQSNPCDCPAGPVGPQGPEGPTGATGPQGDQGIPGINGTNGADGVGNVTFALPTKTLSFYVNKGGNDSTATGTIASPYLTITAALNSITDASTTKRYQVIIGTGRFDETVITLKPWVWLVCGQRTASRTTSVTNMTISSAFSSGNNRAGVVNCLLSGTSDMLIDLQAIGGSGSTVIEFQNFFVNNRLIFKGRSTADFLESWDSQIIGDFIWNCGSGQFRGGLIGGNIYISDEGGDSVQFAFANNELGSNVTLAKTLSNTYEIEFIASPQSSFAPYLVATGSGMIITYDAISMPRNRTIGAGVVEYALTAPTSIEFTPTNTTAWPVGTNTVQKALDYLISRVP